MEVSLFFHTGVGGWHAHVCEFLSKKEGVGGPSPWSKAMVALKVICFLSWKIVLENCLFSVLERGARAIYIYTTIYKYNSI